MSVTKKQMDERHKLNRTILFKGISIETGEWVEGDLVQTLEHKDGHTCSWIKPRNILGLGAVSTPTENFIKIIPKTLSQFTGLNDSQGNRIFEGDILDDGEILIEYHGGAFMAMEQNDYSYIGRGYLSESTVTGNIHDKEQK